MSSSEGELLRVMALHSLTYCERLFYLEEVEEIRLADSNVYQGRTLHKELIPPEDDGQWADFELSSLNLGLTGKVDALIRRNGELIPYEHKKGRPRYDRNKALAWSPDVLQVCAYGMLLEEHIRKTITEGRVRYHADNITVRVPLDSSSRQNVITAINRAKELSQSLTRPPITANERLCLKCSLAPVCLPEEERLKDDPQWQPVRLFPANRETKTVHVTDYSAKISRAGNSLSVEMPDQPKKIIPVNEISSLVLHGYPQITTQALHCCAYNNIGIHWINPGGTYLTAIVPDTGKVQRRIRQYQALTDENKCLQLTRLTAHAKVESALRYIMRATRNKERTSDIRRSCRQSLP